MGATGALRLAAYPALGLAGGVAWGLWNPAHICRRTLALESLVALAGRGVRVTAWAAVTGARSGNPEEVGCWASGRFMSNALASRFLVVLKAPGQVSATLLALTC